MLSIFLGLMNVGNPINLTARLESAEARSYSRKILPMREFGQLIWRSGARKVTRAAPWAALFDLLLARLSPFKTGS